MRARLVALARPGRDGPGLAAIRPPVRTGRRAAGRGSRTGTCPGATPPGGRAGRAPRQLLEALLRDKVARVLGTTPDRLDGDRPLLQLGIDSLMAVELRNWIEGELRVNLPIVELMRSPSCPRLAELLAEQLEAASRSRAARRPATTGASSGAVERSPPGARRPWRLRPRRCSSGSTTSPASRSTPSWPRSCRRSYDGARR